MSVAEIEKRAVEIVRHLREAGFVAYFAGGCVRDRLLDRPSNDIDIATSAKPEDVERLFPRTVHVGKAFGVIRVIDGDHEFEVATFRADGPYTDGRRPDSVTFSSAEEDVLRRDFTINGLLYDPIGKRVLDYVGGQDDLRERRIRAIGDPLTRFREDHLRLLRAVRFSCELDFGIDPATREAIVHHAEMLADVSAERVREELRRILESPRRAQGIRELHDLGLLRVILPEVSALEGVPQPPEYHPEGDVWVHTLRMLERLGPASFPAALAALLHDVGKPPTITIEDRIRFNGHARVGSHIAVKICDRLRMSAVEREAVSWLVHTHMIFKDTRQMRPAKLKRLMVHPGFDDLLALHRADCLSAGRGLEEHDRLLKMKSETPAHELVPAPLVTGDDLLMMGVPPGPRMGKLLRAVHDAQIEERVFSREEAMEWVRRVARAGSEEQ